MLSKQLEGIIKLIRREVNIMGKPILMHRITANSEEEVDRLSHEWFKKMRGKIEVLDTKSSEYKITPLVAILLLSYKLYAQTPHYHNIFIILHICSYRTRTPRKDRQKRRPYVPDKLRELGFSNGRISYPSWRRTFHGFYRRLQHGACTRGSRTSSAIYCDTN
jgi:hypothetical protein